MSAENKDHPLVCGECGRVIRGEVYECENCGEIICEDCINEDNAERIVCDTCYNEQEAMWEHYHGPLV